MICQALCCCLLPLLLLLLDAAFSRIDTYIHHGRLFHSFSHFFTQIIAEAASSTSTAGTSKQSLATVLTNADSAVRVSDVAAQALDTPDIATAFLAVNTATTAATRRLQAQGAAWKSRTARGLLVDIFGATASALLSQQVVPE